MVCSARGSITMCSFEVPVWGIVSSISTLVFLLVPLKPLVGSHGGLSGEGIVSGRDNLLWVLRHRSSWDQGFVVLSSWVLCSVAARAVQPVLGLDLGLAYDCFNRVVVLVLFVCSGQLRWSGASRLFVFPV